VGVLTAGHAKFSGEAGDSRISVFTEFTDASMPPQTMLA